MKRLILPALLAATTTAWAQPSIQQGAPVSLRDSAGLAVGTAQNPLSVKITSPESVVTVGCAGGRPADFTMGCTAGSGDERVINAAIASLPNGGIVQILEGNPHVNPVQTNSNKEILHLASNITLMGSGRGATTITVDPNPSAPACTAGTSVQTANIINIVGLHDVSVHDITLNGGIGTDGANPAQCPGSQDQTGNDLRIDNSSNVDVYNISFQDAYSHGYFTNCVTGSCQNIALRDFSSFANGQIGVHLHSDDAGLYSVRNFLVDDGIVFGNSVINNVAYLGGVQYGEVWAGFIGDSYGVVKDVFAMNTRGPALTIVGNHYNSTTGTSDPASSTPRDIVFRDIYTYNCGTDNQTGYNACVLLNPPFYSAAGSFSNIELDNVNASGAPGPCFSIAAGTTPYTVNGISIRGGSATGCTYGMDVQSNVVQDLIVSGMNIFGNGTGGVRFQTTNGVGTSGIGNQHLRFVDNNIHDNTGIGLTVNGTNANFPWRYVDIHGNNIARNSSACMSLNNIEYFQISLNICDDNVGQDVYLQGSSMHGTIGPNNILGVTNTTSTASRIQAVATTSDINILGNIFNDAAALGVYDQGSNGIVALNHGASAGISLGTTSTGISTFANGGMAVTNNGTGTGTAANNLGTVGN